MRIIIYTIAMLLFVVLDTSIAPHIMVGGAAPNFLIILLVILSSAGEDNLAIMMSIVGGLLLDISLGGPVGFRGLQYFLITFFYFYFFSKLKYKSFLGPMLSVFLWSIIRDGMLAVAFYVIGMNIGVTAGMIIKRAVYTALLMIPFYIWSQKLFHAKFMQKKLHFEMTLMRTKK